MIKQIQTLGLLAILGACGPLNEGGLGAQFSEQFGIFGKADSAPPALAPDIANAAPGDVLLVTILNRNVVAPLTKAQVNGNTITWISPGQVSMTFRDGILIGTRGLQEDLMGVDTAGLRNAIRAGGGTTTRRHSFINSLDQIRTRAMTCTVTKGELETLATVNGAVDAVKYEESCTGEMVFTNSYWTSPNTGAFVRTLQVVSGAVGYIQADQL